MHSPGIPIASGQAHYRERLLDRTFRVSSPSFFQVNTRQAERMVEIVRSRLRLTGGEVLVDAFAGVGTFAVLLAPYARRTIAIEESAAAVRDATVNGQGLDGLELVEARTEDVLRSLSEAPDALILDPPPVRMPPRRADGHCRQDAGPHRVRVLRAGDAGPRPRRAGPGRPDAGGCRTDRHVSRRPITSSASPR